MYKKSRERGFEGRAKGISQNARVFIQHSAGPDKNRESGSIYMKYLRIQRKCSLYMLYDVDGDQERESVRLGQ